MTACEILRARGTEFPRWPREARRLPLEGTCVSNQRSFKALAAKRDLSALGVITSPVDFVVPEQAMRSRGKAARFHVWGGRVPRLSMLRMGEDILVSGPELVIVQLCGSQAKLDALLDQHVEAVHAEVSVMRELGITGLPVVDNPLARDSVERLVSATVLACEFAGTYRLGGPAGQTAYHREPLMSRRSLGSVLAEVEGTANKTRAAEVMGLMYERSASPMETALALMLTLPVTLGGMGLPRPDLNAPVDVSSVRGILSDRDEVSPDMLWREQRLALEYDSSEFHRDRGSHQLVEDARRANILTACGHRVMRVTPGVVASLSGVELLARQLAELLGVSLETPTDVQALRRRRIFAMLMPKSEAL